MSRRLFAGYLGKPALAAPPLRLHTLGGPGLWLGLEPLTGTASRRRLLAFLALLASHGRRGITRDKLLAYLWPESDAGHARNSLKQAVFWLRRVLGNRAVVVATGDVLRLNPAVIQVDAWDFEAAIDRGDVREAVALYQGPYLDGFHVAGLPDFEQWSEAERVRLARSYGDALTVLAVHAEEKDDVEAAVRWWRLLAEADPLSTSRALGLMLALIRAGDPTEALKHFRAHSALVRTELECGPGRELLGLAEAVRGGDLAPAADGRRRWSRSGGYFTSHYTRILELGSTAELYSHKL